VTGRACIGQEQNIIDTAAVKWAKCHSWPTLQAVLL